MTVKTIATAAAIAIAAATVPFTAWAKDDCAQSSKWKRPAGELQVKLENGYSHKLYTIVDTGDGKTVRKSVQPGQTNTIASDIKLVSGTTTFTVKARKVSWDDDFGEEVSLFDMEVRQSNGGKLEAKYRPNETHPEMSCDRNYNDNNERWTITYSVR